MQHPKLNRISTESQQHLNEISTKPQQKSPKLNRNHRNPTNSTIAHDFKEFPEEFINFNKFQPQNQPPQVSQEFHQNLNRDIT